MSRIFSIHFLYKDKEYNALVAMRTEPFFTEYTLNNFDEELIMQLPSNKILSTPDGSLFFRNNDSGEISTLMKQILKAVSEHLQAANT